MHESIPQNQRVARVWIADPDAKHRQHLEKALIEAGFDVMVSDTAEPPEPPQITGITGALIDDRFPLPELRDTLTYLRRHGPHIRPILITSDQGASVEISDSGTLDALPRPVDARILVPLMRQVVRSARDRRRARRLEERLRDAESSKRAILDSSLDCIISTDDKGHITEINAATTLTLGYIQDELIGREMVSALFPESQQERYRQAMRQFQQLGIEGSRMGRRLEVRVLHANGTEFPAELAFIPVNVGGRSVFTAYLRDISERKRAEDALKRTHTRMKRDLEAASRIQMSLLPDSLPHVREAALAWKFRPCDELAGDILNVLRLDRDHLAVYVLDVSGHGVPAALHAVVLHRLLSTFPGQSMLVRERRGRIGGHEIVPPSDVLDQLSERFPLSKSVDSRYFTIHYGIIDLRTGRYCYAQGGHPPPVIVSKGRPPRLLDGTGLPVGFDPSTKYEQFEVALMRDDRLILYSDGVTETSNRAHDQFGDERLLQMAQDTRDMTVKDALGVLIERLTQWRGKSQPEDDISVLALDWKAQRPPSHPASPV